MIGIYVRVSTEEQKKGYSVEGQINDCIKMAKTDNVIKYIDDGYTGEILNRPALTKMLEDAEKEIINKIICYDPDRLSRKLLNQLIITEKLEKLNVELQFVRSDYKSDPEGQLYFQIRGAFSEFDKAKIKHNTMTGRYRKAKKGYVVKNNHLFGYDYDREKKTYVINEEEAKVIKMIFDYFTDPHTKFKGINGIAHHLTELGIPTPRGKKVWHRQVVRQMLMNESYTGRYYQNKYDTEGNYVKKQAGEKVKCRLRPREEWLETRIPRIISDEQFNYAQRKIKQAKRRYTNYGRHNYLLSGLVRCGRCGETMTGRNSFNRGKDYFTYECRKNYAGAKSRGCGRMMSENKLNKIVWTKVVDMLNNPEKINEYKDDIPEKNYVLEEIIHLENQIKRVRNGRKRLLSLIAISDDELDLDEIKEKMRELQDEEKKYKESLEELKKDSKHQRHNEYSEIILQETLQYYLSVKDTNFDKNQMKKIIRMIVEEVVVVDANTVYIHTF